MGLSLFVAAPTETEMAIATATDPAMVDIESQEVPAEPVLMSDVVPEREGGIVADRELYTVYEDRVYTAFDHHKMTPKRTRVRALSPEKNTIYKQRKENDMKHQKEIRTFRQYKYHE